MNHLERFLRVMRYEPVGRVPNWEVGAWPQAVASWVEQGAPADLPSWWWFGVPRLGIEPRQGMSASPRLIPPFESKLLEEDEQTQWIQDGLGRTRRVLKTGELGGSRMSMDTYVSFAVNTPADWQALKRRLVASDPARLGERWRDDLTAMAAKRKNPLVLGRLLNGFIWAAREWMGTEGLSYAWYDEPAMMEDMMGFWADFLIETTRPLLGVTGFDYAKLGEDLAMKTGPLISPETYRRFIFPNLKRVSEHLRCGGVKHIAIDSDGNFEVLLPMMLDAGVDAIWPCERAAGMDPRKLRAAFGRDLRLWGGVDKRELAKGPEAIDRHLRKFVPLIEQGGFIPTVDHTVPPDVTWADFQHYLQRKAQLLAGAMV